MSTTIAKIDIDVESVINKSAETRKALLEISNELKALKEAYKNGAISIDEYTKEVTELTVIQKEYQRDLRAYDNLLQANVATHDKAMQSNKVLTGSIRELSSALSQNKKIYSELTASQRESAEGKALLAIIQQQDKAYKDLQKSIGNTQVEVGNYEQAIRNVLGDHQIFGVSINGIIDQLDSLKEKFSLLSTPILNFINGTNSSKDSLEEVAEGALETGNALNVTTIATGRTSVAMKVFRGALISTGIGAILVLIGSLISYLSSTQEGMDKVSRVTTKLKVGFDTMVGVLQQVGKVFFGTFANAVEPVKKIGKVIVDVIILPLNQVIGAVKSLGSLLEGDFKGAWENASNPIRKLGKDIVDASDATRMMIEKNKANAKEMAQVFRGAGVAMEDALARAEKISDISEKLASTEADFIEQTSILKQQFKEQNKIAEDTTKSYQEREEAALKSIEIQRNINKLAKDRNNLEQQLLELKFASNDTSDADRAELARKKAELAEQTASMLEAETTQNNKVNTIRKSRDDEQRKRSEEAHKRYMDQLKERLDAEKRAIEDYVDTHSVVAKSLEERLEIEEKGKNDRLALLEEEKKRGLLSQRDYEEQKRKVEADFINVRMDLSISAVQQELAMYEEMNQSRITGEVRVTEALIAEERVRQESLYAKRLEAMEQEKRLKEESSQWDYAKEQAHQLALSQLKREFEEQGLELEKRAREARREEEKIQQSITFQERLLEMQEQGATTWAIEREQLAQKQEQEREALREQLESNKIDLQGYNEQLSVMNRKHYQEEVELKKRTEESKRALALGYFGQLKGLFGEQTAIGKASAVAETTINTYAGAQKAYSALAGIPIVGPALGAVAAGVAVASGLKNVHKIMSTDTTFESGGLVQGRRHSEGGVPFSVAGVGGYEMEGGEYVVNRKATARFFPILELINNTGKKGIGNPFYLAQGDLVRKAQVVPQIDLDAIKEAIREGALQGTQQGAYEGAQEGTYQGARDGSVEGTYQGASYGMSEGIQQRDLVKSHNMDFKRTQYI